MHITWFLEFIEITCTLLDFLNSLRSHAHYLITWIHWDHMHITWFLEFIKITCAQLEFINITCTLFDSLNSLTLAVLEFYKSLCCLFVHVVYIFSVLIEKPANPDLKRDSLITFSVHVSNFTIQDSLSHNCVHILCLVNGNKSYILKFMFIVLYNCCLLFIINKSSRVFATGRPPKYHKTKPTKHLTTLLGFYNQSRFATVHWLLIII